MGSYKTLSKEYIKKLQKRNSKYVRTLRKNQTMSEKKVAKILDELGIRYIAQKGFFTPFHRIVDFYLPKRSIIIEVDGKYHEETKEKDRIKDYEFLHKRGFRTLRILNEELENIDVVKESMEKFIYTT